MLVLFCIVFVFIFVFITPDATSYIVAEEKKLEVAEAVIIVKEQPLPTNTPTVISVPTVIPEIIPTATPIPVVEEFKAMIVPNNNWKKEKDKKVIFLTLDDGWNKNLISKAITTVVDRKIKATFFPVGTAVKKWPDIWKFAIENGCEVGNHTYNHWFATSVGEDRYAEDILLWDRTAKEALDYEARWFRPPGLSGFTSNSLREKFKVVVESTEHDIAIWSDSPDTYYDLYRLGKGKTAKEVAEYVIANSGDGKIILMHFNIMDVSALSLIIDGLLEQGYEFKTLSEGFVKEVKKND